MPASAHDAPVAAFTDLRLILAAQQAQLAARLAAVDQAEAAIAHLHHVFGMPPGAAGGLPRPGVEQHVRAPGTPSAAYLAEGRRRVDA